MSLARSARRSTRTRQLPAGDQQEGRSPEVGAAAQPPAVLGPRTLPAAARLDGLVRVFVLLAHVARDGDDTAAHLLAAQHYALRLLVGALQAAAAADSDAAPPCGDQQSALPAVALVPGDWARWCEEEQMTAALATDRSEHALSSLPRPELLLAALTLLADQLARAGHYLAALPVVHLRRLAARCLKHGALSAAAAAALQLTGLLEALELPSEAQRWLDEAAGIEAAAGASRDAASSAEQAQLHGLVRAALDPEQQRQLQPHAAALVKKALAAAHPAAVEVWHGAAHPPAVQLDAVALDAADGVGAIYPPLLRPSSVLDSWLAQAAYLAARGQAVTAAHALQQAEKAATVHADKHALARCSLVKARLALLAGDPAAAAEAAQAAQARRGLSVQRWEEAVLLYAEARQGMSGSGELDALKALEGGAAALESLAAAGGAGGPAALASAAALRMGAAQLLLRICEREVAAAAEGAVAEEEKGAEKAAASAAGEPSRLRALAAAQQAADQLGTCGFIGAVQHVQSLLLLADVMMADPKLAVSSVGGGAGSDRRLELLQIWQLLKVR
jgi:hypothetical protein